MPKNELKMLLSLLRAVVVVEITEKMMEKRRVGLHLVERGQDFLLIESEMEINLGEKIVAVIIVVVVAVAVAVAVAVVVVGKLGFVCSLEALQTVEMIHEGLMMVRSLNLEYFQHSQGISTG